MKQPHERSRRYFLLTGSKDHMETWIKHGFIQQKHPHRIERIKEGDYVVCYASKVDFSSNRPYRKIIGVCRAVDDGHETLSGAAMKKSAEAEGTAYCYDSCFRRRVEFLPLKGHIDIAPIIPKLSFVRNKKSWGLYFISGFREVDKADFDTLASGLARKIT